MFELVQILHKFKKVFYVGYPHLKVVHHIVIILFFVEIVEGLAVPAVRITV